MKLNSKTGNMRKSVSAPCFTNLINDVATEIQLESVFHTPAYSAGECRLQYKFPEDLLQGDIKDDNIKNIATCMAGNCESQEMLSRVTQNRTEFYLNNEETCERVNSLIYKIGRNRRKQRKSQES